EQEPHEVFSGDVVQFGIPVVENAGNSEKVTINTFPPVVALLKLFHPDGKEAKLSFNPTMTTPLHLKELYQLNNFEAIQREASLESRLRNLRECVERTRAEAQASWELFVGEQRLLMRVHTLETMLSMGKVPDANNMAQLLNDKRNYQKLAARCERKMCAARLAIAAAEEREQTRRSRMRMASAAAARTTPTSPTETWIICFDSDTLNDIENHSDGERELHADNNANSTYHDSSTREDSPSSKAGVEYANVLRVMGGLNEEIKVLRERLGATLTENEQLCTALVTRSTVAEEARVAEIQRLASSAADMQAELAFRPTRADIDDLTGVIARLRADLQARSAPRHTLDKCVETTPLGDTAGEFNDEPIETVKLSAAIDEMFQLDYEDDDDTDSATTEIKKDDSATGVEPAPEASAAGEFVRLGDEARLQVTLANGSLHALEEELVRAKERWAEVCDERARLAAQLACLQNTRGLRVSASRAIAFAAPLLAAVLYYLLLPYIS
ncbi:Sarcolemmal membrane-associated protein, partial [Operophtera brumata]